jgi:hypothetical protein
MRRDGSDEIGVVSGDDGARRREDGVNVERATSDSAMQYKNREWIEVTDESCGGPGEVG